MRGRGWLYQLQVVLCVFAVAFAVAWAAAVVALVRGAAVCTSVIARSPAAVDVPGLRAGASPGSTVSVCTESPTAGQSLLAFLSGDLWVLIAAIAAALLFRIVRDARREDPFTAATVRRLRQLTAFVLLAGGAVGAGEMVASDALAGTLVEGGFHPSDTRIWAWLAVGLALAAIAEVVNRGVALRAELDTVI